LGIQLAGTGEWKQRVGLPRVDCLSRSRSAPSGLDLNVAGGSGAYRAELIQWPHVPCTPNPLFTFVVKDAVN
jgi:hypothetical protein